ncbi:hypothetical protein [Pigmentiphaga soli]
MNSSILKKLQDYLLRMSAPLVLISPDGEEAVCLMEPFVSLLAQGPRPQEAAADGAADAGEAAAQRPADPGVFQFGAAH